MILGLVRWLQPVHGYDVRRELLSWGVEEWTTIQPGSIYHALKKLTEEGLLAEVATEQVGARPARTTYRTTEAGEREFEELLRRSWWEYRQPVDPFQSAFAFLPALRREEAVAALRNRAEALVAASATMAELAARDDWADFKPPHVGWMFDLGIARNAAEVDWCRRVADLIEQGGGKHVGEVDEDVRAQRWREAIAREFGPAPEDDEGD